jgi:hypothetical protein
MDALRYIRWIDGIEHPAAGTWRIAAEHLDVEARAHGRLGGGAAGRIRAVGGELVVAEGLGAELRITADATDADAGRPRASDRLRDVLGASVDPAVEFHGHVHHADRLGTWHLLGTVAVGGEVLRATAVVEYRGVYQPASDGANAWLVGRITVHRADLGSGGSTPTGGRRARRLDLDVDLLAVGPDHAAGSGRHGRTAGRAVARAA